MLETTIVLIAVTAARASDTSSTVDDPTTPVPTSAKYLLLDSRNIGRAENTHLVLGTVEKESRNPLFVEDQPWEVRFDNLYANVLYDEQDDLFKVWYSPFIIDEVTSSTSEAERLNTPYRPGKREMGICYAESKDGIEWEKPELDAVEFNGSPMNNIVMRHVHGAGVFRDVADPDPERRFKVFAKDGVAFSPDGIHWSDFVACPEIEAAGDTHNNCLRSDPDGNYVGITRLWADGQRVVGRTVSKDFVNWTKAIEVLRGTPDHQVYAMPVFHYANVFLGLAMVLHRGSDTVDCELAWSPDAIHWERVCEGTPLIPRGPRGSFDSGCLYAAAYPIFRDNEILLYYGGGNDTHMSWRKGGFGLARLRPDGFAGMTPTNSDEPAIVQTAPVICTGDRLCISADAAEGTIRVAVLGDDARSLEACVPIESDVTDAPVTWSAASESLSKKGQSVELVFEIESATLYSFCFQD